MKLNLHLAHLFYAVVQAQGFSRACGVLNISQSAVSKGVRELEHQLGLVLIDRRSSAHRSGSLRLTQAGQSLYTHLQGVFALAHAALEDMQAYSGLKQGKLIIGASTTVAGYWLADLLARYSREHPHISVQVCAGNTQSICQGLIECRMDLAIVEGEVSHPDVATSVWREEPLVVVGAAGVAQRLAGGLAGTCRMAGLNAQTWLMREPGSGTREVALRMLHAHGIQPARTLQIGSNEGIARAAAHGLGLALLPHCLVQDLLTLEKLVLIPLNATVTTVATLSRHLYRLHLAKRPLSPAAQAFSDLLDNF